MKKLKLFSLAVMALITTSLWADGSAYSFEDNDPSTAPKWVKSGGTCTIVTEEARTGAYSGKHVPAGSDKRADVQQMPVTFKGGKHTVHYIAYVKKNSTSDVVTLKQLALYQGSTFASTNPNLSLTTSWQRVTGKGVRTGNTSNYTNVNIQITSTTADKSANGVYVDDVIVYATESDEKTDLKKPGAATSPSANAIEISWTNGTDESDSNNGATGIQKTLIWKRTEGSANDLSLNDQGIYSLTATEGSSTDQSGHWTLVSASVAADATSYSGTFTANDVYAIVHRDLAYNYSQPTYVTITVSATYTVTINPNGGSYASTPEGWNLSDGKYTKSGLYGSFNVPSEPTYSGKDLTGWKDGQGNNISLPITLSKDTTLVAQWEDHAVSSDATLSALSVAGCTFTEDFDPATEDYNTVSLPFYTTMPAVGDVTATKNDANAKTPVVTIAGKVITISCEAEDGTTKTYTVTVNIADMPDASTSINIEQNILDNSKKWGYTAALTAAHISYSNLNSLDSLDAGDSSNDRPDYNEPYFGLKIKKADGYVEMVVPNGQTLKVKFGYVAADLKLKINNVDQTNISKSIGTYEHTASGNELIRIATSTGGTVVLKQIMINEDIAIVRPFEVTKAATENGTFSVDLDKYAKGEEVTVNCSPATGYQLNSIAVSGYDSKGAATDVEVANGKFTMPGSPVTVSATFALADYAITYTAPTNGSYTIKVGDAAAVSESTTANYNQTITLTVAATSGYEVDAVKYNDGEDHVLIGTENVYTFTMPNKAVTVSATFKAEGGETGINDVENEAKAVKRIENGMLIIEKDGKTYNVLGTVVK